MACTSPNMMLKVKVKDFPNSYLRSKGFKFDNDAEFAFKYLGSASNYRDREFHKKNDLLSGEYIEVPCGRCIGCRLDYSKTWATRCTLEAQMYEFNYFITLTYDDDHVPKNDLGNLTLKPKDLQNFMKKLRNLFSTKYNFTGIRFFACGEYGSKTLRPHMHILLFNCPLCDLTSMIPYIDESGQKKHIFKNDVNGDPLMFSQDVMDCWNKGNVIIGNVSWQSAAYVARYICKKQYGEAANFYKIFDVVPEFIRASNRPGIGMTYLTDHFDIYDSDKLVLLNKDYVMSVRPPRYFDKKLKEFDPDKYNQIKNDRDFKAHNSCILTYTSSEFDINSRNILAEEHLKSCLSRLKRL